MFCSKGIFGPVICTSCNVTAMTLRDYEASKNADDPEWYWKPFNHEDEYLYVCPKCKNKYFVSDGAF